MYLSHWEVPTHMKYWDVPVFAGPALRVRQTVQCTHLIQTQKRIPEARGWALVLGMLSLLSCQPRQDRWVVPPEWVGGSEGERCQRRILDLVQFPQVLLYLLLRNDKPSPPALVSEAAGRGFWTLDLAHPHQFKYYINSHYCGRYKLKLKRELIVHFPAQNYFAEKLQVD